MPFTPEEAYAAQGWLIGVDVLLSQGHRTLHINPPATVQIVLKAIYEAKGWEVTLTGSSLVFRPKTEDNPED